MNTGKYLRTRCRDLRSKTSAHLHRFNEDEHGAMTMFAIIMLIIMMMIAGLGMDLMRNEINRSKLQYTLDRAILAAADLDQKQDAKKVVRDYFEKAGLGDFIDSIDFKKGLNFREVSASASGYTDTQLMKMAGVNKLSAKASGAAEERVRNVEISMVLDISGSMGWSNRIQALRNAASTFVDTVLAGRNREKISVSIVPYSEQVNIGPDLYNEIKTKTRHSYSHCIITPDKEFQTADFNHSRKWVQEQHFAASSSNSKHAPICPSRTYERVTTLSNDKGALKDQIDRLVPRGGTAIYQGMKWATTLLDPSMQDAMENLRKKGKVGDEFIGRPAPFGDQETLKTVVLMTDGENSSSYRIKDWAYNSKSEYSQWNTYNLWYYLYNWVPYHKHSKYYTTAYTRSSGDALLSKICTAAKEKNIVIWTIGLEVTDHGAKQMQACASSPAHFFRVDKVEIEDAFKSIARQINQLRLTK